MQQYKKDQKQILILRVLILITSILLLILVYAITQDVIDKYCTRSEPVINPRLMLYYNALGH